MKCPSHRLFMLSPLTTLSYRHLGNIVGAIVCERRGEFLEETSRYNRQFDFIAPSWLAFEEKRTSEHKQSDNADDCDTKVSPMRLYLIIIKIATKQLYIMWEFVPFYLV